MKRALHIIPYDGIGGVEVAARSMPVGDLGDVWFQRCYIVRQHPEATTEAPDWHGPMVSENAPRAHWATLRHVLSARPDLVIASLWRSLPVFLLLCLLRPRMKKVLFLHLPHDVHLPDRILTRLAMVCATEIWADSHATLVARVPARLQGRGRVISFLTDRPGHTETPATLAPNFLFWGRLHDQKDLPRALDLFAMIHARHPKARLTIIGPDGGAKAALRHQITSLHLAEAVQLTGALSREEIFTHAQRGSFYLQTSADEGMALSVIEAMQLGLLPIVTPVGEIASYCRDGENAVFVGDAQATADRVSDILDNPATYDRMVEAAQAQWQNVSLYREDILSACRDLLKGRG